MSSYIRVQYASGLARALRARQGKGCYGELIKPVAPYLALCGNIVSPHHRELAVPFFNWAADNFETVWWVPGHAEVAEPKGVISAGSGAGAGAGGVSRNLEEMYNFVQAEGLMNVHIANKLAKSYSGFKVLGISQPSVNPRNIENVYYGTKVAWTMADLEEINRRDHAWIEKEVAIHNLMANYTVAAKIKAKDEPLLVLTCGFVQSNQFYKANIIGDVARNMSGINVIGLKKSWFGINNWEVEGYRPDCFVEMS